MSLLAGMNQQFAIPVVRERNAANLKSICLALADGGLTILEITLMDESAFGVIESLSSRSNVIIGAGTVLNTEQVKKAIDCGARFLVSPGLDESCIQLAQEKRIPFFPGVLTPSEIIKAQQLNCEMLKVFPISAVGGASYIKLLQGPFPKIKWMATGGIGLGNLKDYLNTGVVCVGMGSQLTPAEKVHAKDWGALSQLAMKHVTEIKSGRNHEKL